LKKSFPTLEISACVTKICDATCQNFLRSPSAKGLHDFALNWSGYELTSTACSEELNIFN